MVYLLHYQLLPEDRLVELMADLFGVKLAAGTIAAMSRNCAGRLRGFVETLRDLIAKAPVKHMDETGFRIGGKTQWLHVTCTALLAFYRTYANRGEVLADVVGVVIHDHSKPQYTMEGVLHALCNAHHLRELKALVEIEKDDWVRQTLRLLRRACHVVNPARQRGLALEPRLIGLIERQYDAIVARGLAFHEAQNPSRGRQRTTAVSGAVENPAARDTISSCVCKPEKKTRCVSFTIPPSPSPTKRRSGMAE